MASLSACWDWKVEPMSPGFASPGHEADTWSLDDDVTLTSPKQEKDGGFNQNKTASELMDELGELDEWIKEEPFADWYEEKIDLPLLDIPPSHQETRTYQPVCENDALKSFAPEVRQSQQLQQQLPSPPYVVPNDTQSLLQEFETVFGEVENNFALTPPQSPIQHHVPEIAPLANFQFSEYPQPLKSQFVVTNLQQMIPVQVQVLHPDSLSLSSRLPCPPVIYEEKQQLIPNLEQIVPSPAPDLIEELAAVDELIRTRVEDLETSSPSSEENVWGTETYSAASSPQEIVGMTVEITPPSPSTTSNSSFESYEDVSDDPEWVPDHDTPSIGPHKATSSRKRSKPYSRVGTEEKRLRKKEQNKNAATRYRQKKKAEVEEILSEEKDLADKNEELKVKVSDISREIKYLKGLMRDVFKAKGLLK